MSVDTSMEWEQQERRRWLTPAQAADHCGIAISTLWKWARDGLVTRHKPAGRTTRFDARELDQVMTDSAVRAQERAPC
jgi:excisionase family DNA binding protein